MFLFYGAMTIRRRFYVYPPTTVQFGRCFPQVLYNQRYPPLRLPPLISRLIPRFSPLREHPAHVPAKPCVVQETLDATNGGNGNVLVPDLSLSEADDIAGGHGIDCSLDLAWAVPAAGGDDLATDVLSHGSGAVQRQQDRGLQLGLGALDLGLGDGLGKAGPLAQGEVHKVIDTGDLVGDKVDTPETMFMLAWPIM